jgi:hypothetical protein
MQLPVKTSQQKYWDNGRDAKTMKIQFWIKFAFPSTLSARIPKTSSASDKFWPQWQGGGLLKFYLKLGQFLWSKIKSCRKA